jgi:hypothetical protein
MCMWNQVGGFRDIKGRANGLKNGAVDLQHETGVEGSLHPCTRGHHTK